MGYQNYLRDVFELKTVTKEMRFFRVSGITRADLQQAEERIKKQSPPVSDSGSHDGTRGIKYWSGSYRKFGTILRSEERIFWSLMSIINGSVR